MININAKIPTQVNYRILELIEQMMVVLPKGTALGFCDMICAMYSGYFIESGGAVMPAVEAYLQTKVTDDKEREARSRRAAKALTYGQYNMKELIEQLTKIVTSAGEWQPIEVQGYEMVAVDFTGYQRLGVKKMNCKMYDGQVQRAVKGVPLGMIASVGQVNGQRMALLKDVVTTDITVNESHDHKKELYKQVAKSLANNELAVFDAGFNLVEATQAKIDRCLIRLAKNCTFGQTVGRIPERTSAQGRPPSQYQAEIVRPLARKHGDKEHAATPADEIDRFTDENGQLIEVHIWQKVYFLERQLKKVTSDAEKARLRKMPLKVIAIYHPDYDDPLLLGTPLLELEPASAAKGYAARWPVEGLPQTGKYILSGGRGTHYVHHPTAIQRLPTISLIFGSLLKYVAATLPPFRTGFWDRVSKPTYGRLLRHLKKVGIPLSQQLFKKASVTSHLPVGYEAVRPKMT